MKKIALLFSGDGSTVLAVAKAVSEHRLSGAEIVIGITSNRNSPAIPLLHQYSIPVEYCVPTEFSSYKDFSNALFTLLDKYEVHIVSQNGWLPLTPKKVIQRYDNCVLNQHPGPLDPGRHYDFGGKGMFGARVTCARLIYLSLTGEDSFTESTVHFATEEFDKGELLRTERLVISPVNRYESANIETKKDYFSSLTKDVQSQLLPVEHNNVIESLQLQIDSKAYGYKRSEALILPQHYDNLNIAKSLAITWFPEG